MSIDLDCGIPCEALAAWLDDDLALSRDGDAWTFLCPEGACRIRLDPLPNQHTGTLAFRRTRLQADGDQPALDAFYRRFTLRFISAGG